MPFLTITPEVLQLLNERRILDLPGAGRRWRVGQRLWAPANMRIEPYNAIFAGDWLPASLGAFSYSHSAMAAYAAIGRYCSIGAGLTWMGGEHPAAWATTSPIAYDPTPLRHVQAYFADVGAEYRARVWQKGPPWGVEIGNDVWIGDGVMLAPTVKIGHGAVIGARSLVLKDVPAYAIVAGSPARVIRYRFPEPLIERMLALEWWRYRPEILQAAEITDPERFVEELPRLVEERGAEVMTPPCLTWAHLERAAATPSASAVSAPG